MTAQELADIHAAAFIQTRPWSTAEFGSLLAQPTTRLIESGRSFILACQILDEIEILTLATHPDVQRRGLAANNLEALLQTAREYDVSRVFLEVAADNTAARALYVSLGFGQIAVRPAYYARTDRSSVDALILEKSLT